MVGLKTKAFTLAELLVVVIVLGVLATVAVPQFTRVLETRRTTEAEDMLASVRTEQEKRCALGQQYTENFSKIPSMNSLGGHGKQMASANYTYTLTETGVNANRSAKKYELKMPSYKKGQICCEGKGCGDLNKHYSSCAEILVKEDECAADICEDSPNSCSCPSYAQRHLCECYPSALHCCADGEVYINGKCMNACEAEPSTVNCCTEEQIDQGMVYKPFGKLGRDLCSCPSGTALVQDTSSGKKHCCPSGTQWNGRLCEETCREGARAYMAAPLGLDTCDGDVEMAFSCSSKIITKRFTCTDYVAAGPEVRAPIAWGHADNSDISGQWQSLSSVWSDPFVSFTAGDGWLSQGYSHADISPTQGKCELKSNGWYCSDLTASNGPYKSKEECQRHCTSSTSIGVNPINCGRDEVCVKKIKNKCYACCKKSLYVDGVCCQGSGRHISAGHCCQRGTEWNAAKNKCTVPCQKPFLASASGECVCPKDYFKYNGGCYRCPSGYEWDGNGSCIKKKYRKALVTCCPNVNVSAAGQMGGNFLEHL